MPHTTSRKNKIMQKTTILKCSQNNAFYIRCTYCVPIKLCKTGSIPLFKITGILMSDKVKINKHYIWDILEIDCKEIKVTFNGKAINVPESVTIKLQDKFKVRHMMESQPLIFHLMLKQGFNWFMLASKDTQVENV